MRLPAAGCPPRPWDGLASLPVPSSASFLTPNGALCYNQSLAHGASSQGWFSETHLRCCVSGLAHLSNCLSGKPSPSDLWCAVHPLPGLDFSLIGSLRYVVFEIIRVGIWLEKQVILSRPLNMIERRKSRKYFGGNVEWKTIGCVCFKMRVTMEYLYVIRIMIKRRMLKIQRKEVFKKAWRWDLVPKRWLYQFLIGKKICPPLLMS